MKITKTKSGRFTTVVSVDDQKGKRHCKRFTGKNKDAVRNAANDYVNQHKVYYESMTFRDAMQRYIDRAELVLSPSTIAGYKSNQRTMQTDYERFCALSCDRITERDVQLIVDDMRGKGRTVKSIRNRLGLISAVLTAERCPMPRAKLPQPMPVDYVIPGADDIQKVSAACTGPFERMAIPVGLAVFGLRRGEICAVTAKDIDGEILHVRHALAIDDDGFYTDKAPKTSYSVRDVAIPAALIEGIMEQGRAWKGSPNALTQAWPHLLKAAGVKYFRLHDCRHFFVSYCHEVLQLSDAQIMKLGGWKTSYVMVSHYRHTLSDQATLVASKMGALLSQGQN